MRLGHASQQSSRTSANRSASFSYRGICRYKDYGYRRLPHAGDHSGTRWDPLRGPAAWNAKARPPTQPEQQDTLDTILIHHPGSSRTRYRDRSLLRSSSLGEHSPLELPLSMPSRIVETIEVREAIPSPVNPSALSFVCRV
jgi:hypothetical protein